MKCVKRSENNLQESVLSIHHVGTRDPTQAVRLHKQAYSLSQYDSPKMLQVNFNHLPHNRYL